MITSTYLYVLSFSVYNNSGIALVCASDCSDAFSILKRAGKYNGTPSVYQLKETRTLGIYNENRYDLLLEVYSTVEYSGAMFEQLLERLFEIVNKSSGKDGKSAYEIAVEQGFIGTEEEWLDSLHGKDGSASLSNPLDVVVTVGGVKAGANYASGTSLEKIFVDMLSPTLNPTLTPPSAGLSFNVPSLAEVGTQVDAATATVSLNRGAINPPYGADEPFRSGPASGYALKSQGADVAFDESNVTGVFSVPAFSRGTKGAVTFTATVEHGEGCQPKDSAGGDFGSPLPAGSVATTKTVNFIFPFLYGVSDALEVSSLDGLNKDLSTKSNKTYSFDTANQHMRIAFDSSYGHLSSILDPNGFETISGWKKTIVGNYTVYTADRRTTDTGAAYTFKF